MVREGHPSDWRAMLLARRAVPAAFEARIAASASKTEGADRGITSNIALNPENYGAGACFIFLLVRSGGLGTSVAVDCAAMGNA